MSATNNTNNELTHSRQIGTSNKDFTLNRQMSATNNVNNELTNSRQISTGNNNYTHNRQMSSTNNNFIHNR